MRLWGAILVVGFLLDRLPAADRCLLWRCILPQISLDRLPGLLHIAPRRGGYPMGRLLLIGAVAVASVVVMNILARKVGETGGLLDRIWFPIPTE